MGLMSWLMGGGCDNVTTVEVKDRKKNGEDMVLVDVRTPAERASRKIDGSKHIPLQELDGRAGELPRDRELVIYCQNGIRSIMACRILKQKGFTQVKNLEGGINRW